MQRSWSQHGLCSWRFHSFPLPSPPCRTEIITKVNNFVLLNLSIALLLALIVFVSGIEGGKWNVVSGKGFELDSSQPYTAVQELL